MSFYRKYHIVKWMFLSVILLTAFSSVGAHEGLCSDTESVVFNCQVHNGEKIVSVCRSKTLTKNEGYLQYRFGTEKHLELEYPAGKAHTQEKFYFGELRPYQSNIQQLSFARGSYIYTLDRREVSADLSGVPGGQSGGGITVQNRGKKTSVYLECTGVPDADFFGLWDIVRDEKELIDGE